MRIHHPWSRGAVAVLLAVSVAACGSGSGAPAGGSGAGDPYFPKAGNGGYDVRHYALDLAYDPGTHRLTGTATITARATRELPALNLDLEGLDVEEVAVDGDPARWSRDGQELTVRPREAVDGAFRVTVRYAGAPETVTDPDGSEEGWLRTADGALALGSRWGRWRGSRATTTPPTRRRTPWR
ncbi:hypothetical protein SHKM778_89920 [Streptomyces sp. KM77-8]|uniref:M1 family peptidase n=1 Tax=Streptomyces haneummycinicus TaxID=3074435 RepID=A0AAT9HZI1_9ACTN